MNQGHSDTRNALRIVGLIVLFIGIGFSITGFVSFFSAFADSAGPPKYFWCVFVGFPLVFIGILISKFGFMGAVVRYAANEVAPVGKDVVNYMADGTKDSIQDVAAAIGEGLRSGEAPASGRALNCQKCDTENDESAAFCDNCGAPLSTLKQCGCGELNDQGARFCDSCGVSLT